MFNDFGGQRKEFSVKLDISEEIWNDYVYAYSNVINEKQRRLK